MGLICYMEEASILNICPFANSYIIYIPPYNCINSYSGMEGIINEYVEAIKKEISLIRYQPFGKLRAGSSAFSLQPYEVISIFFGGGTPTVLESGQLIEILESCKESFN